MCPNFLRLFSANLPRLLRHTALQPLLQLVARIIMQCIMLQELLRLNQTGLIGKLTAYAVLYDTNIINENEFKNKTDKILKKLNRYEIFAKGKQIVNALPTAPKSFIRRGI